MSDETQGAAEAVADKPALAVNELTEFKDQVAADQQEDDNSGDDAAAATDEPAPKPRKSAQERIDEITAKHREAEREAEYWRTKALQGPEPKPTAQPEPAGRPDPATYDEGAYDPRYVEDVAAWRADQIVNQRLNEERHQTRMQTAIQRFDAKTAELYPDGEPAGLVALRRAPNLPNAIADVILGSDIGPKLAEHLGDNPREFNRLSALPPHLQAYELGKLEARLAAPAAPKPKTATDAPEPTPQVRGAGGRFAVDAATDDFMAFQKQFGGT